MIFRSGYRTNLPRKSIHEEELSKARELDVYRKNKRKEEYNSSCHTKHTNFQKGNQVLVFSQKDSLANGKIILVKSSRTGRSLKCHPNDIKLYEGVIPEDTDDRGYSEGETLQAWKDAFALLDDTDDGMDDELIVDNDNSSETPDTINGTNNVAPRARRSTRERAANPRYFNDDFEN